MPEYRVMISWQPTNWVYNHWVVSNGEASLQKDTGSINPLFPYDWSLIVKDVVAWWQQYLPDFYISGWKLEPWVSVENDDSAPWGYWPPAYSQRRENRLYISAVPYTGVWGYARGGGHNGELTIVSQLFGQDGNPVYLSASDIEIFMAHEIGHMLGISWHCEERRDCIMRPGGPVGYSDLPGNVVRTLNDAILSDDCLTRLLAQ